MEPIQTFLTKLNQRTENEFQTHAKKTISLAALCFVLVIMACVIALRATLLTRRISESKQETLENALGKLTKYGIFGHKLEFIGLCESCLEKNPSLIQEKGDETLVIRDEAEDWMR